MALIQTGTAAYAANFTQPATVQFPSNTTSGNAIIVAIAQQINGGGSAITGLSDTSGNTYNRAIIGLTNQHIDIWYAQNITGGTTPVISGTVNSGGTIARIDLLAREYSNLLTSNMVDGSVTVGGAAGTRINSGTYTTTNANDLLFVAGVNSANVTWTSDILYSNGTNIQGNGALSMGVQDKTVNSTGANFGTFVTSGNNNWVGALVAFKTTSPATVQNNTFKTLLGVGNI